MTKLEVAEQIDKLRDYLRYDPATGFLYYRYQEDPSNPDQYLGRATTPMRSGYSYVKVYGLQIAAAQVVWLLHHGRWPYGRLTRRDGDTLNDRIENLKDSRSAPASPPVFGPRKRRNASRGVSRCGPDHWQAYCRVNGKQYGLGRFRTEAEALEARAAWERGDDLV